MVKANSCINGLAHGIGKAASLTGLALIEGGEWVLGALVAGTVVALPQLAPETGSSFSDSVLAGSEGVEE